MGKNRRNFNENKRPTFPKRGPQTKRTSSDKINHVSVLNNLREIDVGITEYISQTEGFNATIKSRFSDFHVNEIDMDGNVVKLTERAVPYELKIVDEDKKENEDKTNDELETKLVENSVPIEQMDEIKKIVETGNLQSSVEINVTKLSKEQRTAIHKIINQMFKGGIITTTQPKGEDRFIKCTKFNKNVKHDRREKWPWPAEYTYFVLHKQNIDTLKAVSMLSGFLRCHQSTIVYAGTKDKRAKTSQLCCMRKRKPDEIVNAAKRIPMIHVGNFHFKNETLKLGHLNGNRFRIALRNVTAPDEVVNEALDSLESKGFINYFGLQRFGNSAKMPTYDIGKALIKADWKLACELIMKPRENDLEFMNKMRTYWWESRDATGALDMLRRGSGFIEAKLLEGLVLFGKNDYFTALGGISRNMRLLYIHSYQSLIWNKVASRRIKEWGLELREGDLVFADKTKLNLNRYGNTTDLDVYADLSQIHEVESEENGNANKNEIDNDTEEMSKYKALAKPLTKQDIKSGKYTIHDVVLPLPGYDILYPSNDTEKWYVELLAEDGLSFDSFKNNVKLYALPGDYRPLIVKPKSVKWHLIEYKSPIETLILSDLEELLDKTLEDLNSPELPEPDVEKPDDPAGNIEKGEAKSADDISEEKTGNTVDEIPKGGKAIIIEFDLPSSCYATMVLREILKIDTSVANQIKLSSETRVKRDLDETGEDKRDILEVKKIKSE